MYAVNVKPCAPGLIQFLVDPPSCVQLSFAREHNISGDEDSSDQAKPRQNRRVQFSYYKHQWLP